MKKLLIALTIAVSLIACGSDKKETKEPSKDISTVFSPIIAGTWVMTDYITDLGKTKSPKASAGKLEGIVSMIIDPAIIQGDTITVAASWNNHEGYTFYLFFRQGQNKQSLATDHTDRDSSGNFYELSYDIKNNDTTLALNHYNKDKKLLHARQFTKVRGPLTADSEPYGLQYMANKVLLAGSYNATDDEGKKSKVTLTEDGMAKGMGTHTTYYIFTDFTGPDETNLDEMCFDFGTKTQKPYIFEIKADTVLLYKAMENEERTLLICGPLKYTLVKE